MLGSSVYKPQINGFWTGEIRVFDRILEVGMEGWGYIQRMHANRAAPNEGLFRPVGFCRHSDEAVSMCGDPFPF